MRTLLATVWLLAACGCSTSGRLGVQIDQPTYWRSESGELFVARYGRLTDGSLEFVKVTMPDGRRWTLPRAVSASGARYTDEMELVWWEHHGTVRVDVRRDDGQWGRGHWTLQPEPQSRLRGAAARQGACRQ